MIFADILERIERAALAGKGLKLDVNHARALVASPAYGTLCDLKAKEMAQLWQESEEQPPQPVHEPSSGRSGSGSGPIAATGASAGTMTAEDQDSAGRAASRRASEAVKQIGRQPQQKMR